MTTNKKPLDAKAGELDGTQGATKQHEHTTSFYPLFQINSRSALLVISAKLYGFEVKGGGE